ncbi:hypothetical protein C9424_02340 [Arthrobacter sp. H-02-3]|nr:hypothetical protein C9424_02340 [Arthrobacter sp. H-02-3]
MPAQRVNAIRGTHQKQSDWPTSTHEMLKGRDQYRHAWRKRRDDITEDEETGFLRWQRCTSDLTCREFV